MIRHSLQHIAHGSDGALFFQWRASASGVEQYHSGMVPHAGPDTRQWREVVELGRILERIEPVAGSLVEGSRVAIVADIPAKWAWEEGQKPIHDYPIEASGRRWHEALSARGLGPDVVSPRVRSLGLRSSHRARTLRRRRRHGGVRSRLPRCAVRPLSWVICRASWTRRIASEPAATPVRSARCSASSVRSSVRCSRASRSPLASGSTAVDWTERLRVTDAEVVDTYAEGDLAGLPAVTRRSVGAGRAWYVSADIRDGFDVSGRRRQSRMPACGARLPVAAGVEAVRRKTDTSSWLFLINHGDDRRRGLDVGTRTDQRRRRRALDHRGSRWGRRRARANERAGWSRRACRSERAVRRQPSASMIALRVCDGRITPVDELHIRAVVAADLGRRALHSEQFGDDRLFVRGEPSAIGREHGGQLRVGLLRGELLRPVEGEVEVAAAVVDRAERATGRLVVLRGTCRSRHPACRPAPAP